MKKLTVRAAEKLISNQNRAAAVVARAGKRAALAVKLYGMNNPVTRKAAAAARMKRGMKHAAAFYAAVNQFQKDVSILSPAALAKTETARLQAAGNEKRYKPLTSHKAPNVGNMIISADCYTLPKIIVGAKIKAARRRGVVNAQNVYIQYYMEMLHTAFLAVYAARIQESVLDEMRTDIWYQNNPEQLPPKMEMGDYIRLGCRACGRFAYSIEKRGQEKFAYQVEDSKDQENPVQIWKGIGDQHIKNNTRVPKMSPMENRIESAVDTKDFYERAKKAIMYLKTSQRNKEYLLTALDGKAATLPRPVDTLRNLDRVLKAARLIDSDVTGRRFIV